MPWTLGFESIDAHTHLLLLKTICFGDPQTLTFVSLFVRKAIAYRIMDALSHSLFHMLNGTCLRYQFSYHLISLFL